MKSSVTELEAAAREGDEAALTELVKLARRGTTEARKEARAQARGALDVHERDLIIETERQTTQEAKSEIDRLHKVLQKIKSGHPREAKTLAQDALDSGSVMDVTPLVTGTPVPNPGNASE